MKNIKWLNHIIELIIVILGIYIAFSINKFSDNRRLLLRETTYLDSFLDEINDDLPRLDTAIIQISLLEQSLEKLISLIKDKSQNNDSLNKYIGLGLYSFYVESPNQTTFESLQSSGNLDIIQNFELRKEIISYYNLIEDLEFIIDWDFKHHNEESLKYLPNIIKATNKELLEDSKLLALAEIRLFLIKICISRYEDVKNKAQELKIHINNEIE